MNPDLEVFGNSSFDISDQVSLILQQHSPSLNLSELDEYCVHLADEERHLRNLLFTEINESSSSFISGLSHMSLLERDLMSCRQFLNHCRSHITKTQTSVTGPVLEICKKYSAMEEDKKLLGEMKAILEVYKSLVEFLGVFDVTPTTFSKLSINIFKPFNWTDVFLKWHSFSKYLVLIKQSVVNLNCYAELLKVYIEFCSKFSDFGTSSLIKILETSLKKPQLQSKLCLFTENIHTVLVFNFLLGNASLYVEPYFSKISDNLFSFFKILLRPVVSGSLSSSPDWQSILAQVSNKKVMSVINDLIGGLQWYLWFGTYAFGFIICTKSGFNENLNLFESNLGLDCKLPWFDLNQISNEKLDTFYSQMKNYENLASSNFSIFVGNLCQILQSIFQNLDCSTNSWPDVLKIIDILSKLKLQISQISQISDVFSSITNILPTLNSITENLILSKIFEYSSGLFNRFYDLLSLDQFTSNTVSQLPLSSPKVTLITQSLKDLNYSEIFSFVGHGGDIIRTSNEELNDDQQTKVDTSVSVLEPFQPSASPLVSILVTDIICEIFTFSKIFPDFQLYFHLLSEHLFLFYCYHIYIFFGLPASPPAGCNFESTVDPSCLAVLSHLRASFDVNHNNGNRSSVDNQKSYSLTSFIELLTSFKCSYAVEVYSDQISMKNRACAVMSISELFKIFHHFQHLKFINIPNFFRFTKPIANLTSHLLRASSFNQTDFSAISIAVIRTKWEDQLPMDTSSHFVQNSLNVWKLFVQQVSPELSEAERSEVFIGFAENLCAAMLDGFCKVRRFGNSGLARLSLDLQLIKKELTKSIKTNRVNRFSELEVFSKLLWLADVNDFLGFVQQRTELQTSTVLAVFKSGLINEQRKRRKTIDLSGEIKDMINSKEKQPWWSGFTKLKIWGK
ncbi:hypothetical protein GEMRC1_009215 [Eukaryota sp. GEM-RC1]